MSNTNLTATMIEQLMGMDFIKDEIVLTQTKAVAAHAAKTNLPAISHTGEAVTQRANLEMESIKKYWIERRDAALKMFPRNAENDAFLKSVGIRAGDFGRL